LKKLFFAFGLLLSIVFSVPLHAGTFYAIGRGEGLTNAFWKVGNEKEESSFIIGEKVEVFCIDKIGEETFILGGVWKNRGYIWVISKDSIILSEPLPEANVIYGIKKASDGKIWAVGSHKYMGACVWSGTDKGQFQISSILRNGSVAYSICEGKSGDIFVGGVYFTHGKVWMMHNGQWNMGDALNESKQINSICADKKGTVYACGQKIRYGEATSGHGTVHQGGVWTFNGEQWGQGTDIPESIDIYCSAVDNDGNIILGGAGFNDKTVWKFETPLWKPYTIDNCLALYAMYVDAGTGTVATAGWNKQRRGKIWFKPQKKEWDKGYDIPKCFSVKGLISIP
jgi:hypothetical protein